MRYVMSKDRNLARILNEIGNRYQGSTSLTTGCDKYIISTIIPNKKKNEEDITNMASKYEYLKTTGIVRSTIYPPFLGMIFHAQKDNNFQIRFTHVSVPFEGKEDPHKHEFAQVFVFVPCTPDLNAYDAETELFLGDEGEKIVINQTCAVFVPAGLTHCPIIHKRVGTPFFFVNCPISGEYSAIVDGHKQAIPVRSRSSDKK